MIRFKRDFRLIPLVLVAGLKKFPDTVLAALQQQSEQVMDKFAAESDLNQRIWTSMKQFRELATPMGEATDKNIYEWR